MKIGIYSPYLDALGGGERYMLTIAEYLSKKHIVDIFWNDKKIKKRVFKRLAIGLKRVNFVEDIFYSSKNLLKKLILSRKYNLIIFLSDGSIPTTFAKRNILHFQRPFPGINSLNRLNKVKLTHFQAIICNSYFTKKFIDKEFNVNSSVIYPPVDVDQFKQLQKRDLIISVGRFNESKKQKETVYFFKKMSVRLAGWELYLIGGLLDQDRDYFNEIKVLIGNTAIKLLVNESFENLTKHYAQAKIYWHAAGFGEDENINPTEMEHFGISTVEGMAAGCVPIVFDGGGQREIINHGKNGFLWKKEKELADYTLRVLYDEKLRAKISEEAIKKSKMFSKEKFCRAIDKLINNL